MRRTTLIAGLFLILFSSTPLHAFVRPLEQPAGFGSQLIFYYDTRPGFTTFLNVRSGFAAPAIRVRLDFWGPSFESKVTQTVDLPIGAGRVIDAGALKTSLGLGAQQGIAFASVIDALGNPVHVGRALMGNFTVANLATGSAWGAPALGRSARVVANDTSPTDGTVVDGTTVAYQTIQPIILGLGSYYDPQSLAPVEDHGNQLIFVSFKDPAGAGLPVTAAPTMWDVFAAKGDDGQVIFQGRISVSGVEERDVVSLFGDDANGSAGGALFSTSDQPPGLSRLIFLVQSLGTFGTGYLLPAE